MPELADTLQAWRPRHKAIEALFSPEEVQKLETARRSIQSEHEVVVYCVWENPFARAGGIFAVATHLPPSLRKAGFETVLISPFHRNLESTPPYDSLNHIGTVQVPYGGAAVPAELFEHFDGLGNRWVLIQSWGIFDAGGGADRKNPYAHVHPSLLLRDSLFASAAVPAVLEHLGLRENLYVHAQDWQLAPVALTVKEALLAGRLKSAAVALTSHNPYDQALSDYELARITKRLAPEQWPLGRDTVYQRMIPLTDVPLSTVSRNFAVELQQDPLQTRHFARHLQHVYEAHGVVGIDNPLFGEPRPAFSDKAIQTGRSLRTAEILREKFGARARMLETLAAYEDPRIQGGLDAGDGRPLTDLPNDVPVFMMFGRMDPGQKGFDLLARAIEAFPRGSAKFILTPIVSDANSPYAQDLAWLAKQRRGDVAVYPFRMERGYMEAMAGASYAVMPSIYEPFGAATEAYLAGTPVVARAAGGLIDQVVDYRHFAAGATGFLFREKLPLGGSWPAIINASSPEERAGIPLYVSIAETLYDTLQEAAALWGGKRIGYGRMLSNLHAKATSFSGERAASEYAAYYRTATAQRTPQ